MQQLSITTRMWFLPSERPYKWWFIDGKPFAKKCHNRQQALHKNYNSVGISLMASNMARSCCFRSSNSANSIAWWKGKRPLEGHDELDPTIWKHWKPLVILVKLACQLVFQRISRHHKSLLRSRRLNRDNLDHSKLKLTYSKNLHSDQVYTT